MKKKRLILQFWYNIDTMVLLSIYVQTILYHYHMSEFLETMVSLSKHKYANYIALLGIFYRNFKKLWYY